MDNQESTRGIIIGQVAQERGAVPKAQKMNYKAQVRPLPSVDDPKPIMKYASKSLETVGKESGHEFHESKCNRQMESGNNKAVPNTQSSPWQSIVGPFFIN